MVSHDLSESSVVDTDDVVIAPASAVTTTDGTVGSRFVQVTLASVTADQFAGALLSITDDTGEGYSYRIKGNTATGDPATGDIRLSLYDPIQVALDATSDIAITGCLYANLEPAVAGTDEVVAGVTVATQAAADYGFVQTKGCATVLTAGSVLIKDPVIIGAVAGSVSPFTAASAEVELLVGQVVHVGDDTGHSVIKLLIGA
jgi:hypothetical protein